MALVLPLVGIVQAPVSAEPASAGSSEVDRESLLTPDQLGDGIVDGLQYADPSEGLAMVQPPEADSGGSAQLSYPLVIPPGRGITPDLALNYDSGGGNGWVGLGWDLSVGEISVDTAFGAPHFDPAFESESYLLDGDVLVPNATDGAWEARQSGDRQDYTRQQETEYEQIIRHEATDHDGGPNGGPDDYYWEVRDKGGNVRWYGGHPDVGGPDGGARSATETIDRSAIVYDDNNNAVRWLLSAQRDVGVNQIRYHYTKVTYARTAGGWSPQACSTTGTFMCGRHTYLSRIDYTEAAQVAPDPAWDGDAAYQVHLTRQTGVRDDPIVDATGRYVDVIDDRLVRVEVKYGDPEPLGAARTYDQVAARYDLEYIKGPFGKSLLSAVIQVADPVAESARHSFTYNNTVDGPGDNYAGFDTRTEWNTGEDLASRLLLEGNSDSSVSIGALGASESNSAEGHAYIGFNAVVPQKVGSFGGSIQIGAGGTEALAEWIDINGDSLPDKVFREGNAIKFRLNESGPDGGTTFSGGDDPLSVADLPRLSREISVNFQLSVEAHLGITLAVGIGGDVAIGDSYFTDINADGLPDFVSSGKVYFNRLVGDIPTFQEGSLGTIVPLPTGGPAPDLTVDEIADLEADLKAQSPLIDTVRRWTAPFNGTISINAPVTFTGVGTAPRDGVRVAIQHNDDELAAANLINNGATAFGTAIPRTVERGHQIYFRVGSVNNGENDEVSWNPTITYTSLGTPALDANGLSQIVYSASADFTLAGRPNSVAVVPYTGTVRLTTTVTKSAATSDDVEVVVLHNGAAVSVSGATIPAAFVGNQVVTVDFPVAGPVYPTAADPDVEPEQDTVEAYLAVDSPIDLTAVSWQPRLFYLNATDSAGDPVVVNDAGGNPQIVVKLLPEIEQYPNSSRTSPVVPYAAEDDETYDLVVDISRPLLAKAGTAIVTVKNADGELVDSDTIDLIGPGGSQVVDLDVALEDGTDYFFDIMIRDPEVSDDATLNSVALRPDGATDADDDIDVGGASSLRWRGRQTIFPLAYRGWAVAGYTAEGANATDVIKPAAFIVDESRFDESDAPTGFDDIDPDNLEANVEPAYAFVPLHELQTLPGATGTLVGPLWRGPRDNHAVTATLMRSSRLGADSVSVGGGSTASGEGSAVTRVGLALPTASLAVGIGPFGGSLGIGPSFGLVDYEDMNGDGYPDVITPGNIHYTNQRGAFLPAKTGVDDLAVTNQDLTISASGGLSVQLVDIPTNVKGKTNATQGSAAGKGGDASDSSGGVGIGGDVSASWTSPNASGGGPDPLDNPDLADVPDDSTGGTAPIQIALADINGDGLPDRVFTTPQGVFAQYNLGYRFTTQSVQLTTGGFEAMESYAGTASLGFSTPWAEFSGGVALNWNYDQARYTWRDINGDGIVDQVHKRNGDVAPLVAFGTGSGMVLPPVEYGAVESVSGTLADNGQQAAFDRSNGLGGGFDFTVYIGPICVVACYLVINPGASFQNSVSTSQVDLQDVNGDGYADSISTTDDDSLWVRLNKHGATNLLKTVTNPLGGTIDLSYERVGNTLASPESIWALSRVDVNDGRPGDGADIQAITYEYAGLRYDRVHRQSLGFSSITARELNTAAAGEPALRVTTSAFYNSSVFTAGLLRSVTITTPTGVLLRRATTTYGFRDMRNVPAGFDVLALVTPVDDTLLGTTDSVASRGRSIAPLVTRSDEEWFENGTPVNATAMTFTYDGLGNMLTQRDAGEIEDTNDDLFVTYVYSNCDISSTMDPQCPSLPPLPSPIFSEHLCPTWVSIPAVITVTNGKTGAGLVEYRHRDGRGSLCDNASITHLEERIDGSDDIAETELAYDEWGSYNRIVYPTEEPSNDRGQPALDLVPVTDECIVSSIKPDAEASRYAVSYVYDEKRHSDIESVTEYQLGPDSVQGFLCDGTLFADGVEGLTSTATFNGPAGRVASRTDVNDNTISYTYDSLARIKTISSPRLDDGTASLITYEYHPTAAGYGYAVASHLDMFNTGKIDTYTFVDGTGRITQTKRDARLFESVGVAPIDGRSVSGATNFDALGRAYEQYLPSKDTVAATTYNTTATGPVETTVWDLQDRPVTITAPGSPPRATSFVYGSAVVPTGGPTLFAMAITEPNGRLTTTYKDVRDVTRALDERPLSPPAAPVLRSTFVSDAMGQLLTSADRNGKLTSHTYDKLGRRTSTTTPDGGLVEFGFDAEGKLTSRTTPNLRPTPTTSTPITYDYEFGKLVSIDYPGTTPDVSYEYGVSGDLHNGAGRIVREEDGSRIVTMEYAESGAMTKQVAEMKYHDWFNSVDKDPFRWTTTWTYDGLGRMATMTYPDGEMLTYDYDSGGLAQSIVGVEEGLIKVLIGYDVDGNPIYEDQPHTWTYDYLKDRQYDEFLRVRWQQAGNNVTTEYSYDPATQWLARQQSLSPDRDVSDPAYFEIQDLNYTFDQVGNPTTYRNNLPPAVANQFGGSSVHRYRYDGLERIVGGTGVYDLASKRHQRYEFSVGYDANGNVATKSQYDATVRSAVDLVNPPGPPGTAKGKNADLVNAKNTFSFTRAYSSTAPHQATTAGTDTYHYDKDGNLLGIKDRRGRWIRQIRWDANDRMTLVTDGPSSTEYSYDDSGQRTIERGPAGETAFVNPWVTTRNKNEMFKHIWVDNNRIATQRDDGPYEELKRYFLHLDLQGSTNVVTDAGGETFQHHEYFPNGDVWINEKSTAFRTPYQFGGGYVDETRDIVNFEARWYDQNRELFYAPDPVLSDDPTGVVGKPALAAAYAYAGSNPIANVDPSGREFITSLNRGGLEEKHAKVRAFIGRNPDVAAAMVANLNTKLPRGLVSLGLNIERADRIKKFADALDAKPIVEIDPNTGTVKLSLGIGPRLKIPKNKPADAAADPNQAATTAPQDATSGTGTPAVGSGSAAPTGGTNAQAPAPPPGPTNNQGGTPPAESPTNNDPPAATRQRSQSAPPALTGGTSPRADE
jgi:RHS repeat-associated protein